MTAEKADKIWETKKPAQAGLKKVKNLNVKLLNA